VVRDFRFAGGETLPELRLHYRTLGRPRRDAAGVVRNAVLVLHGTGGAGTQFLGANFAGELFGPGQPLDTARYYVVLPDNVGPRRLEQAERRAAGALPAVRLRRHGRGAAAPARRRARASRVCGSSSAPSMGCMHAWVWGTTHPGFADALAPFACVPAQIAGRNRMLRRMAMDAIRLDPAWRGATTASSRRGSRRRCTCCS
jgi:homoserine O-acetyltransferase